MFSSSSRLITWMIWLTASIFYAYQYVLRVLPNIILNDIMQRFDIDAATFGQFSGIYYIGYSLMHLPVGIMLDRFGPKKIMSACILLTVVGLSPLVLTHHWLFPIVGRLLVGLGSSAAILGLFKVIRMAFKEEHFTRMLSFSITIGLIGAIYGGGPVSYMRETLGYEAVVYLFGVVGVLLAAVTYSIIPDSQTPASSSAFSDIKEILSQGKVLSTCFFAGLMVGPLEGFADVWGTIFLRQVWGLDPTLAASLPSMIFIGMCFGTPVLSFIAEKTGNYFLTIISAGIVMALSFTMLLTSSSLLGPISLNFLVIGVACAYQVLAIYKTSTYVRQEIAGLTTAVANMIIMTFGYVFHTIMGSVIQSLGGPSSSFALRFGVSIIPIALTLGSIGFIFLFIQEKKSVRTKNLAP